MQSGNTKLARSLSPKHIMIAFEVLTYGLEGGPMTPEVVLQPAECGYDELGPYYSEFPVLGTIDYARAEEKALAFMTLYGNPQPNLQSLPKRQAINCAIQSIQAHEADRRMLEMDMLGVEPVNISISGRILPFVIENYLPNQPASPLKDYKPRRRGQKPTLLFGKGTNNGRK